MNILDKNWLTESPFDYELKRYKLLAAVKKIMAMIDAGQLYSSLIEVESQLNDLYRLKHGKQDIDNRLKVLKGINLDTMSLEYEYPEDSDLISHIYQLCDIATNDFEDLFKIIRNKWRLISKKVNITEIPSVRSTRTKGYVFVLDKNRKDNNIITYSYNKPSQFKGEWKDLDLIDTEVDIKNIAGISNFIETIDAAGDNFRFWRCDHSIEYNYEDGVLPIIKYNLFYKISIS